MLKRHLQTCVSILTVSAFCIGPLAAQPPNDERTPSEYGVSVTGAEYRYEEVDPYENYRASRPYGEDPADSRYVPTYSKDGDYRQPVRILLVNEGQALVATKKSGQFYLVDVARWRRELSNDSPRESESQQSVLGAALSQVIWQGDAQWGELIALEDDWIAAADTLNDQVCIFRWSSDRNELQLVDRLPAPGHPHSLTYDAKRKQLFASGQWSQRLYRWSRKPTPESKWGHGWIAAGHVDLPMCGGRMLALPTHGCIMVVDAFGRDYAIVDTADWKVTHHSQLYGHNVPDLALTASGEMIYFPHQLLNEYARSVRTDITWGGLLSNNIRWLRTDRVLRETGEAVFKKGKFYPLGTPGNGAGDPTSMDVSVGNRIAITLGGMNRVAIGKDGDYYFQQFEAGLRPVDCQYTADGKALIVVNQFSDSLTLVNLEDKSVHHLELGDLRPPNQVERGEMAFFNARLSHDGWMSCQSCHSQGHSNGQLNDNFTDATYGTPKRILSLLGQANTMPYSWGGKIESLEQQVGHSLVSTMASDSQPHPSTVNAIAAFVRSLEKPPSLQAARKQRLVLGSQAKEIYENEPLVAHGNRLFKSLQCTDCHGGQHFTSTATYDVGIHDEDSMTEFNPPSLVGVSQRQNALLHDGRAKSLRDVIDKEKHQLPRSLADSESDALVAYLQSL